MKNILKKKNILLVSVITVFIVFMGYSFIHTTNAEQKFQGIPTDNKDILSLIKPIIHVGGGDQAIEGSLNLNSSIGSTFSATDDDRSSVFEKAQDADSFFAVLGNSWIGGRLFVGVPRSNDENGFNYNNELVTNPIPHIWKKTFNNGGFGPNLLATLQKVNVQGDIIATNLIHSGGSDEVCIDANGSLIICSGSTYHWEVGDWSDCSAGGSGTCSGTWTTTTNGSCSGDIDPFCDGIGGLCDGDSNNYCSFDMDEQECLDPNGNGNEYSCIWYSCSDISHLGSVECNQANECYWNDGINYCNQGSNSSDDCLGISDLCTWHNGTSTTHYCSDKDGTSASECTGYNDICSWTEGGDATKTRTVVCKDASGNTVADSFCTGDKPATSEAC